MLVVLPYSHADASLALALLEHISRLGALPSHQCLLVHTPDGAEYEESLVTAGERCFGEVRVLALEANFQGWPQGPNSLFQAAAIYCSTNPSVVGPWYFFEPDNTPTRSGWLDLLEAEYFSSGKACMGAVVPTRAFTRETHEAVTVDSHMVGSGIYPKDIPGSSLLFATIMRSGQPWDLYMQYEIVPNCHPTISIQHLWQTKNARREGTEIIVDAAHELSQPEPVRPEALVVHGIKDGSLIHLLRQPNDVVEDWDDFEADCRTTHPSGPVPGPRKKTVYPKTRAPNGRKIRRRPGFSPVSVEV